MKLLKKIKKIDKLEKENINLQILVVKLQNEQIILNHDMTNMKENMLKISSMMAEKAIIQRFLTDQIATTHELVLEIDKLFHPKSYLKYDLTNEPYN